MIREQVRVLVVDDSPEDQEIYRRFLRGAPDFEYILRFTDSGEEGLELCQSEKPDCVVLDYRVPDLDGLQFLQELEARQGRAAVPLVMATGQGDESVAVQAMKNGAHDYLVKGTMSAPELRRAIHNAVEKGSLREKIEQQRAALEKSHRLLLEKHTELEQYAYVASHDLQEPLRMIASYLQLLERRYKDKLDDDAGKYISYAVDGAARMQQLIRDLLAFSRVSTRGKDPELVDCEVALGQSLANLRLAIQENDAIVTHESLPRVMADGTQLIQLLQNFVGNSIKYRGEERPRIHVSARRNGAEWEICVRDNGIGLDPQFAERIFVMFQRLHSQAQYPGTGIGLSICKKIVQRHGGRVWVESQPGKGAAFFFSLPADPATHEPAETQAARAEATVLAPRQQPG